MTLSQMELEAGENEGSSRAVEMRTFHQAVSCIRDGARMGGFEPDTVPTRCVLVALPVRREQ